MATARYFDNTNSELEKLRRILAGSQKLKIWEAILGGIIMKDGATLGQARRTLELLDESKLDGAAMQKLIESGHLAIVLQAAKKGTLYAKEHAELQKFLGLLPLEVVYSRKCKFSVDYGKRLDKMFRGKCAIVDNGEQGEQRELAESLLRSRAERYQGLPRVVNALLVRFDRKFFDVREAEHAVPGYRPAYIEELLAFGATTNVTLKKFVVAPQVYWRNLSASLSGRMSQFVNVLHDEDNGKRTLTFGCFEEGFSTNLHFLYVEEQPKQA